jgi:predicted RND superfamily exporter protein
LQTTRPPFFSRFATLILGVVAIATPLLFYGRPALFCSVTTALGLLSLCASELTPIRKFGAYSALGVMLMLGVLFVYLPAALQLWPVKCKPVSPSEARKLGSKGESQRFPPTLADLWNRFGGWIIRRHMWVTTACVALTIGVGFGVTRVRTNIDLMKLFDSQARVLQDYQWLEAHVGRLVPLEVVLRFGGDTLRRNDDTPEDRRRYSLLERFEIVAAAQRAIEARFGSAGADVIGPSMSPITFVPPLPLQRPGTSVVVRRSVTNSRLQGSYGAMLESGYLRRNSRDGSELWRISVRVAAFRDVDYGRFASDLRNVVDPLVAKHVGRASSLPDQSQAGSLRHARLSAVYTGVVPIVYKAQRAPLDSLIQSTFWSFITITPLLMFVSRGVRAGVVAMLPNVLPVLMVFGGMGWLGLPVDIGSMMSASIALGVAVDDTIHYLTWYREDLNRTGDRHAAILAAYRRCATPTLQAALISGLGLSVFAFSTFTPTRQFGYLMLTILLAGVVAELVLLPALLAGPLGSVFRPRPHFAAPSPAEQAEAAA